jgi:hypothetical protein
MCLKPQEQTALLVRVMHRRQVARKDYLPHLPLPALNLEVELSTVIVYCPMVVEQMIQFQKNLLK